MVVLSFSLEAEGTNVEKLERERERSSWPQTPSGEELEKHE